MFSLLLPIRLMPWKTLVRRYIRAGAVFGDSLSYIYMGECIGFRRRLRRYKKYEAEIIRRGYIPYALGDFVGLGGRGIALPHELRKAGVMDEVVAYAAEWEKENPKPVPAIIPWWQWFGWGKDKRKNKK